MQQNILGEFSDGVKTRSAVDDLPNEPLLVTNKDSALGRTFAVTQYSKLDSSTFYPCSDTVSSLPAGMYNVFRSERGLGFNRREINVDEIIQFTDGPAKYLIEEIRNFWSLKDKFLKYGFLHRRGYLLYGVAGSGKSCVLQQIIADIIERDGIVILFSNDPYTEEQGLSMLRRIEPDRPLVYVLEDIDAIIRSYGENGLLAMLDGETQINNVLNIATTNFPERLEKRIVARPRRFDRLVKIGMPSATVREEYFRKKLNLDREDVGKWVEETEGLSFAALADLVISVKCLGNDFNESVDLLRNLVLKKVESSEDFDKTTKLGF